MFHLSVPSERLEEQECAFKDICVFLCVRVRACALACIRTCLHLCTKSLLSQCECKFHTQFICCSQHQFTPSEELTLYACSSSSAVASGILLRFSSTYSHLYLRARTDPYTPEHTAFRFFFEGFQSPQSVCRELESAYSRERCLSDGWAALLPPSDPLLMHYWLISLAFPPCRQQAEDLQLTTRHLQTILWC